MQIMTRVNRMVALHFENTNTESPDIYKQIPSICTRLTGELYFHKPGSTVVESHISNNDASNAYDQSIAIETTTEERTYKRSKSTFLQRIRKSFRRGKKTKTGRHSATF
uniref:Caspase family p10 domain-containing protein n=1 Tax=Ciona intestinalis TaxID=7719 RepID=F7A853_CIOIN